MYYKVQQGDSMATIGNVFGIPQLDIERVNPGVEPAALAVGSYVKLPPWDDSCPAPGDTTNCRVYVAESGDSLSIISTAFVVDLAELQVRKGMPCLLHRMLHCLQASLQVEKWCWHSIAGVRHSRQAGSL
jgi:hypothetical protein